MSLVAVVGVLAVAGVVLVGVVRSSIDDSRDQMYDGRLVAADYWTDEPHILSAGFGFDGIIVAFLARLHPLGVPVAALFLAALLVGGDRGQTALGLPGAVVRVPEAALLFGVLAGDWLAGRRLVVRPREAHHAG